MIYMLFNIDNHIILHMHMILFEIFFACVLTRIFSTLLEDV